MSKETGKIVFSHISYDFYIVLSNIYIMYVKNHEKNY